MGLLARSVATLAGAPLIGLAGVWLAFNANFGAFLGLPVLYGCIAGAWIAFGRGRSDWDVTVGLAIGLAAIVLGLAVGIPIAISASGE